VGNVRMVWPEPWHAGELVRLMSDRALAAFAALGAGDPVETIRAGVRASMYAWCALDGEDPLCIGGVVPDGPLLGDVGRPWMVSQPALARHPKRLLRESRARLAVIRRMYPVLTNFVSCDYPKSLRWLAWLGFAVGGEELVLGTRVRRVTSVPQSDRLTPIETEPAFGHVDVPSPAIGSPGDQDRLRRTKRGM